MLNSISRGDSKQRPLKGSGKKGTKSAKLLPFGIGSLGLLAPHFYDIEKVGAEDYTYCGNYDIATAICSEWVTVTIPDRPTNPTSPPSNQNTGGGSVEPGISSTTQVDVYTTENRLVDFDSDGVGSMEQIRSKNGQILSSTVGCNDIVRRDCDFDETSPGTTGGPEHLLGLLDSRGINIEDLPLDLQDVLISIGRSVAPANHLINLENVWNFYFNGVLPESTTTTTTTAPSTTTTTAPVTTTSAFELGAGSDSSIATNQSNDSSMAPVTTYNDTELTNNNSNDNVEVSFSSKGKESIKFAGVVAALSAIAVGGRSISRRRRIRRINDKNIPKSHLA